MKPVRRLRTFEKHFKLRIAHSKKLSTQFESRLNLFIQGKRDYPIDDHPLTGSLQGKRAFSIANDIRVIYEETDEAFIFLDIGSHNQVY